MIAAGFRPAIHNRRRLQEHLGPTPAETLERFRAVVDSTTAPSNDTAAYLGEVIVHSHDIRHPLGITTHPDIEALTQVAQFFARRNFTVQSRSVAHGLWLRATDGRFDSGAEPVVAGPTLAPVMTMAGRPGRPRRARGPRTRDAPAAHRELTLEKAPQVIPSGPPARGGRCRRASPRRPPRR